MAALPGFTRAFQGAPRFRQRRPVVAAIRRDAQRAASGGLDLRKFWDVNDDYRWAVIVPVFAAGIAPFQNRYPRSIDDLVDQVAGGMDAVFKFVMRQPIPPGTWGAKIPGEKADIASRLAYSMATRLYEAEAASMALNRLRPRWEAWVRGR